jgi:DNA-binding transcriptional ArsR family regulator
VQLKKAPVETIAKVFGALIDCEGSIRYNKLTRSIYVRMCNKEYLEDWKALLEKIGIKSRVSKHEGLFELTVTCNQNFRKLNDLGFWLHNNRKRTRFESILSGYKKLQVERHTALKYYQEIVKARPNLSAAELSTIAQKDKRTVSHYLKRLFSLGMIKRVRVTKQKYVYF